MRIRIAAPVLVGALALGAVALPTAASAATAAPVITKAAAPSVVLGLRGKVTLAVTVSASDAGGVKAIYAEPYPAAFYKAHGRTPTAAEVKDADNLLKVKASTATTQTAGLSVTENVTTNADLPPNALAGAWGIAVLVVATDGSTTFNVKATTFSFKRADTLTAKVSATKVRKGANLTVKGLLKRANWDKPCTRATPGSTPSCSSARPAARSGPSSSRSSPARPAR